MKKQYYFLSGLPRSGTTLLGAILNQNPKIHVGSISPLLDFMGLMYEEFLINSSYKACKNPLFEKDLLESIAEKWYSDINKPIIIDKNRGWTLYLEMAKILNDDVKIISTVRPITEILASFINLLNNNHQISYIDKELIEDRIPITNDSRCDHLMGKDGIVYRSLNSLLEPFLQQKENLLLLVNYDELINDTDSCFKKIYSFLELDYYEHDFNNIEHVYKEDDSVYGIDNFHEVRKTLKQNKYSVEDILSEYVIKKYSNLEFWNNIK